MSPAWIDAAALPLDEADIDTGTIFPSRFLRMPRGKGYQHVLFRDRRFDESGREIPGFLFNQPAYRGAGILVAGRNFGCGSSRENAVFALLDYGIRCVIAPSYGEIFFLNAVKNGLLPVMLPEEPVARILAYLSRHAGARVAVDLEGKVVAAGGGQYSFRLDPIHKRRLLQPFDGRELARKEAAAIEKFEAAYYAEFPWLVR